MRLKMGARKWQAFDVRILAQSMPDPNLRKLFIFLGSVVVFIYGAYELAQYIIADDITGLAYIGLAVLVTVSMITVLGDWRTGTYIFFGWIFVEDLARKYLGNNMLIYFGKDILVGVVYVSFLISLRRKQIQVFKPPFGMALYMLIWFGTMQIFNPASNSMFYGLMGMKLYFYYVPLMFIGYALIETEKDLQKFNRYFIGLAMVVAALGIVQAVAGPTFLNPGHLQEDIRELSNTYRVAPVSGVIVYRPNSVFVSTGRFTFLLVPAWLFTFGFGCYLIFRSKKYRLLTTIALGVITLAVVLGTSRGTLMWTMGSAIVCTAAFFWGCPWQHGQIVRILRTFQRSAIIMCVALALGIYFYPDAIKDRVSVYVETLWGDSVNNELAVRTGSYPIQNFLNAFEYERWPYGYGIGTGSLGTQYVTRIMRVPPMGIGVESGFGTLVVELGIVGLILWIIMSFAIVITGWRVVRRLRGTALFPVGFVIFWYSVLMLFLYTYTGFQPYEDYILNALLWISLGILFRLSKLPVGNLKQLKESETNPAMMQASAH
jgi:hypothetical protein